MGRIHRLPADLANQIAAGEVVERPASVVKELVENALDAEATRVKVELDQGGVALVRVTDDGLGMDEGDAVLSLERHATSKIGERGDLFALKTFGFRGEALPSIASVAKLALVTRARGAAEGVEVVVEGGGKPRARPVGASAGTSVQVTDLFFNVPARRKFLKSTGTEAAHVSEVMLLAALSRPEVSFFLVRDGRAVREWLRAPSREERVRQALDGERLEPCPGERGPLRIEAYLSAPERARAGAVGLHLFVNGRPVRDRQLARAVAQAYGSVLEPGRYPVGVVYLDLPPDQVDVNVHPQKAEVRFAEGRALFDAVLRELHSALGRAFNIPSLGSPGGSARRWGSTRYGAQPSSALADAVPSPDPWKLASPVEPPQAESLAEPTNERTTLTSLTSLDQEPSGQVPASEPALFDGVGFYASLEFLAQVRGTFLVCSGVDGLYVLDQHAAAERVTFHRLRRSFAARTVATQRLLIPVVVELLPAEVAVLEERGAEASALGVEMRAVGASAIAVHSVPTILARANPERIVRDLLAELGRAARRPFGDAADLVLATMACHGSIRAGDAVSREEATALLRALDEIDFAGHCPHGRPVVTRIGYDDLERRVGR
jgi:DNA mismatch repair protein MutL